MVRQTVAHAAHPFAQLDETKDDGTLDAPESTIPATWQEIKASERAHRACKARAASTRRRNVDPTTCDLDYSRAQLEFMQAMQTYKESSGRTYPDWSEVLAVLLKLGYEKGRGPGANDPPRRDVSP